MAGVIVCFVPEMNVIFFVWQDSLYFDLIFASQSDARKSQILFISIMTVECVGLLSIKSSTEYTTAIDTV